MVFCRRVVRPWLGLKMIDLNEMIIAQLKERNPTFPNVDKGILVPMVCILVVYFPDEANIFPIIALLCYGFLGAHGI